MAIPLGSHSTVFVYPKLSLSCGSRHRWKVISHQPRVCELWFPWNRLEINSTLQVPVIYYYLIKSVRTNAFTWRLFHRPSQRIMIGFVNASFVIRVCVCVCVRVCVLSTLLGCCTYLLLWIAGIHNWWKIFSRAQCYFSLSLSLQAMPITKNSSFYSWG